MEEKKTVKAQKLGKIKAAVERKWTTQSNESCFPPKTDELEETDTFRNYFLHFHNAIQKDALSLKLKQPALKRESPDTR